MIDMDQVEDFYEALSAAIESGLDTPGAHAVSDMYRAALARAVAAKAERDELAAEVGRLKGLLTVGEQEEIIGYIRDRIAGNPIDLDDIPKWLADLEQTRQENAPPHEVHDDKT